MTEQTRPYFEDPPVSSIETTSDFEYRQAPHHITNSTNYVNTGDFLNDDDKVPIVVPDGHVQATDTETHVYKRRWYIMFVYALLAFTQAAIWNTWSPIAAVSERVFDWTDATVALLANWGPISYLVGTFAFSWIIDVKGLRWACIISAVLVAVGTGLRCITDQTPAVTWLVHVGQFLNGLAGPVAMGAPPVLSAVWFPPEQRTTSTALATVSNTLGVAVSFVIGPYMVPDRVLHNAQNSSHPVHSTQHNTSSFDTDGLVVSSYKNHSSSNGTVYDIARERQDVMLLMYIECGWSVFCLLMFFTYFPTKPPIPPSKSASIERLDFKSGLIRLTKNGTFWLIGITYGVSLGVYNCWQGILDVNLKPHGISEDDAGWLGFYGIVAACVSGLVVARMADIFSRHMKWFILALYLSGGGCLVVFTLNLFGVIPFSKAVLYVTFIFGDLLLNAAVPLFFETACEVSYPVAEGITNFVLTLVNNIGGLIFLAIQMIPHIGTNWENWCLLGAIASCIPVLLFLKESYNRLEIDDSEKE